ncbi:MAG: hypothetical protein J6C93_06605 [Clostridia bacterium]|nr:hypothetical protein [Clostridia bacterium]
MKAIHSYDAKKPKATAAGTVKKHANDNGKYSPTSTPQRYTSSDKQKPTERRTGNNPTPTKIRKRYKQKNHRTAHDKQSCPTKICKRYKQKPTERRTGNNPTPQRYTSGDKQKPTERRTASNPTPEKICKRRQAKTYQTPHGKHNPSPRKDMRTA